MTKIKHLNWPLIIGLGLLALARPVVRIVEDQAGITNHPITPVAITVAVSIIWIATVGFSRITEPVLTLILTGLVYGVASIIMSGILTPILVGHLEGPLAHPAGLVPDLAVNAVWGLITGVVAALVQRARSRVRTS